MFVLFIGSASNSVGQELKYRGHLGVGLTDLVHAGLSKRFGKVDVGAQAGYLKYDMGRIMSGGVFGSLRFGHSKKFDDAPTVFFKQLLNCHNDRNTENVQWYWFTTELLMGRNFYFTEHFGLSAELGLLITVYETKRYPYSNRGDEGDYSDNYPIIFLSPRIQAFFRF